MRIINLKNIHQDKYKLLTLFIFFIILLSRLLFLGSDLPDVSGITVEIEEKPVGINARNMIFLNHWPVYLNWCQPMVYSPLPNMISFIFFRLFEVGLTQFRLPFAIAGFVGLIFFYIILLRQTNRFFAVFGFLVYSLIFEVTVWNRSALPENLYLLFMPLSIYFLTKDFSKDKNVFAFVFFAAMNMVVKTDGYPFFLAAMFFLIIWAVINHSIPKTFKLIILGVLSTAAIYIMLFSITGSFKYFIPMYKFLAGAFVTNGSLLDRIPPSFVALITLMIKIDPYILISFLAVIPLMLIKISRFNRVDWFMAVFLFFTFCTRLTIPVSLIYWKRLAFLYFPIVYFIMRALYFLWSAKSNKKMNLKSVQKMVFLPVIIGNVCLMAFPIMFSGGLNGIIFNNKNSIYFLIVLIFGTGLCNLILFYAHNLIVANLQISMILFLLSISLIINSIRVAKMFVPENVKYSYQENVKYAKLIPEKEIIISDEQGVRGFEYLSSHDFLYNADGGHNPIVYREILERKDLRYFILDINAFERKYWSIPNKVRLELVKETYPDLKLLGVMYVSKIPMAIYDKYGNE